MNHYLTTTFAASLLILFSGCLGHLRDRPLSYRAYGHSGVIHADYLEPACDSCSTQAPMAGGSCETGSCATGHCDRCDGGPLPVGAFQGMPVAHRIKQRLACGDGCGEVYIGEWISTPPTADPCDYSGNYTGAGNDMIYREHAQPVRTTLRKLAGIRFLGTRYSAPWAHAETWGDDMISEGEVFEGSEMLPPESYEAWSPEMMSTPNAGPAATTSANPGFPYRTASTHSPSCNCGR